MYTRALRVFATMDDIRRRRVRNRTRLPATAT